jgi:curli production assembly/transport component CsgF
VSAFAVAWAVLAGPVLATDLVYTPINPLFGGNPNNAPGLLAQANAQSLYKAPVKSGLQAFNDNLQQAILSRLSSQALTNLFGKNSNLVPGNYDTGAYTITVTDMGNGILKIVTTDKSTGAVVSFEVGSTSLNGGP